MHFVNSNDFTKCLLQICIRLYQMNDICNWGSNLSYPQGLSKNMSLIYIEDVGLDELMSRDSQGHVSNMQKQEKLKCSSIMLPTKGGLAACEGRPVYGRVFLDLSCFVVETIWSIVSAISGQECQP